jgi:citrate lyase subunit beta/citryl-CoA lyase
MRSMLFVPADSERKLVKAMAAGADAVILDLEDSISIEGKPRARGMAREFLQSRGRTNAGANSAGDSAGIVPQAPAVYVRINGLSTPFWQDDVAALSGNVPDGVMLPKSESGEHVHRLSIALGHTEQTSSIPSGTTRIVAIATEVAQSVLQLPSYIGASNRLVGLTWGAEDLSVELGSSSNREADGTFTSPYRLVRDLTLITAAAAGVQPIDTVYVDFRNSAGLALEASVAARDGFTGKMAIHPDQVPIINAAFTPSPAEIARSEAIVAAFDANPGAGVAALDGQMLDRPHLERARRILARAASGRPA